MKQKAIVCTFAMLLALTPRAFSFGEEGHEAIAILAEKKLETDSAKNVLGAKKALDEIHQLLNSQDMASVSVWADWIRLKELQHVTQQQINDINARFPGNGDWHFADLPLGTKEYSITAPSAGPNDVVSGINKCVAMLESADTSAQQDHHAVALKFIIHLVGDIDQPLHVACAYYHWGSATIERDPAVVAQEHLPDDRGGNNLLVAPGSSGELHAIWDSDLVFIQAGKHSKVPGTTVASTLAPEMTPNLYPPLASDYHNWAAAWAADSVTIAVRAYDGISVPPITDPNPGRNEPNIPKTPMLNFDKGAYIEAHKADAHQQLLKASCRLAELLEKINWHD